MHVYTTRKTKEEFVMQERIQQTLLEQSLDSQVVGGTRGGERRKEETP